MSKRSAKWSQLEVLWLSGAGTALPSDGIVGAFKLKLAVEASRTSDVGRTKTGARGSSTVYRIIETGKDGPAGRLCHNAGFRARRCVQFES
jgi:hypothetical protein